MKCVCGNPAVGTIPDYNQEFCASCISDHDLEQSDPEQYAHIQMYRLRSYLYSNGIIT